MISFREVDKSFGEVRALRSATFTIERGGIVGMLGPNGAGKTTAMRIMTGFLAPTGGEVLFDGTPFGPDSVDARRRIGYLPESAPLYDDMLAWDYLVYEARLHGIEPTARVAEVIRLVGLDSHAHKPIRELSRGFRQRVGLAHALLHDPELLILDEPTNGLDPNQILQVRALIRRIAATTTVVLSTHIMQEVEALCDRVLVIHRGTIRYEGPIAAFASSSAATVDTQRVRLLVGGIGFFALQEALQELPGFLDLEEIPLETRGAVGGAGQLVSVRLVAEPGVDVRPEVCRLACEATRFVLYEMYREATSLEDVFHELTAGSAARVGSEGGGDDV